MVESVRIARRVGPNQQLTFDLVAEVTQCMRATREGKTFPFYGGATVILDSTGTIRFVISKRLDNEERKNAQWDYLRSPAAAGFWTREGNHFSMSDQVQRRLCASGAIDPPAPRKRTGPEGEKPAK
jgi:hypothetical protein